jgi:hypothetical protein
MFDVRWCVHIRSVAARERHGSAVPLDSDLRS